MPRRPKDCADDWHPPSRPWYDHWLIVRTGAGLILAALAWLVTWLTS